MKRVYLAAVIVLTLLGIISIVGVGCTQTTGYKQFILNEGLAPFSFEYPAFYYEPRIDRSLEPQCTVVDTSGVIQPRVAGAVSLTISVFQVGDSYPNAQAMLDDDLGRAEGYQDFQLLECSPVTVAGIQGELIIYSYYGYHHTMESKAETGTTYKAYFDSEGLVWKVVMLADEYAAAERARADFEHILETFQILD